MDCRICFPLRIDLKHRDYFKPILLGLHVFCLVIIFVIGGMIPATFGVLICIFSLKFYWEQQKTIGTCVALDGIGPEEWRLQKACGGCSVVELEGVLFIGPLLTFRLKRYGDSMFWVTRKALQDQNSWHRLRVLKLIE